MRYNIIYQSDRQNNLQFNGTAPIMRIEYNEIVSPGFDIWLTHTGKNGVYAARYRTGYRTTAPRGPMHAMLLPETHPLFNFGVLELGMRGIYPMHSITDIIRKRLANEYKAILKK